MSVDTNRMREFWDSNRRVVGFVGSLLALGMFAVLAAASWLWLDGRGSVATGVVRQGSSLTEYAARLKKDYDSVHIYEVGTNYEVWTQSGKWRNAGTLEDARQIVDAYYEQWASNCVGPVPPGRKVE